MNPSLRETTVNHFFFYCNDRVYRCVWYLFFITYLMTEKPTGISVLRKMCWPYFCVVHVSWFNGGNLAPISAPYNSHRQRRWGGGGGGAGGADLPSPIHPALLVGVTVCFEGILILFMNWI